MTPPSARRGPLPVLLASALALSALLGGCATSVPLPVDTAPPAAGPAAAAAGDAALPVPDTTVSPVAAAEPAASEAAGAPVDPLEPDVAVQLDDLTAQSDLWARVRRGFSMPDLDGDLVHDREQWYATRPDYVQRMTERGSLYLFHIVGETEKRGLPTELALLPFIESAFNPQALSVAKASGMWQFMPGTGLDFELRQNLFRDDRRDVLASTRAALDYLTRLHDQFGDWHLALAAYNWGEGNVQRAIARNQKAGLPTDYESLRMPAETRQYVPKLQAVKNIVLQPANYGLTLPALANHPYFLAVPIERDIDVDLAARLAGLKPEAFKALNPQMNKPVILAAGTPQVLLPYDNASEFLQSLRRHEGPLASWTAWVAPKTLKPADAARQVGMSESQLREVNRIPPRMLVKAGSTLLVPRGARSHVDVPEQVAENAKMLLAPDRPPLRRVAFKAGRNGETVAAVAKRYGVGAAQVAQWNQLGNATRFAAGAPVVVYLPNKAPTVRTASAAAPIKGTVRAKRKVQTRTAAAPGAATERRTLKLASEVRSPAVRR